MPQQCVSAKMSCNMTQLGSTQRAKPRVITAVPLSADQCDALPQNRHSSRSSANGYELCVLAVSRPSIRQLHSIAVAGEAASIPRCLAHKVYCNFRGGKSRGR